MIKKWNVYQPFVRNVAKSAKNEILNWSKPYHVTPLITNHDVWCVSVVKGIEYFSNHFWEISENLIWCRFLILLIQSWSWKVFSGTEHPVEVLDKLSTTTVVFFRSEGWLEILARNIKESIYFRVNNPTLNNNIGKFNLSYIWDRVLLNTKGLTLNKQGNNINTQPN